ncbi:hypothetical protein BJ741DRAFT_602483 [Chytriomyces cf. hyalinus JEL632]|nr:hypothetical protein BJ741DRAFT_602483 [Chytriomyces cf. hyalinus JEL632]
MAKRTLGLTGTSLLLSPDASLRSLQSSNEIRSTGPRLRTSGIRSPLQSGGGSAVESRVNLYQRNEIYQKMIRALENMDRWHVRPGVIRVVYHLQLISNLSCCIAVIGIGVSEGIIACFCVVAQVTLTTLFILYRNKRLQCLPKPTDTQNAAFTFVYLVLGCAFTFALGILFMIAQNDVYTAIIACCDSEFAFTKNTCFGEYYSNGTLFSPSTCTEGTGWKREYLTNQNLSFVYAAFCVFQCLSHHWTTSEVVRDIKKGHIFRTLPNPGKVHPVKFLKWPKQDSRPVDKGGSDLEEGGSKKFMSAGGNGFKKANLELSSTLLQEEDD